MILLFYYRRAQLEANKGTTKLPPTDSVELLNELEDSLSKENVEISEIIGKSIAQGIASKGVPGVTTILDPSSKPSHKSQAPISSTLTVK